MPKKKFNSIGLWLVLTLILFVGTSARPVSTSVSSPVRDDHGTAVKVYTSHYGLPFTYERYSHDCAPSPNVVCITSNTETHIYNRQIALDALFWVAIAALLTWVAQPLLKSLLASASRSAQQTNHSPK